MLFKDLIEHKNVSELKNFCRWSGLTNFTQVSQINMVPLTHDQIRNYHEN